MLNPKLIKGFGLIELIVAIAIVGILAAIGVPSYLNWTNKSREIEPRTNLIRILNEQKNYHKQNGKFALTWEELAIDLPQKTNNYRYSLFQSEEATGVIINSHNKDLKSYLGGVKLVNKPQLEYFTAKCQSIKESDELKEISLLVGKNQLLCGKRVEVMS